MGNFYPLTYILSFVGAVVLLPGCATTEQETSRATPVMIYDTATGQAVSNNVHNMRPGNPPSSR